MDDSSGRKSFPVVAFHRIRTFVSQHPNVTILLTIGLCWWTVGRLSRAYRIYRYEQDWLVIVPPPKGVSDLGPNTTAPIEEWTIQAVCPSWIACQRFLKGALDCDARGGTGKDDSSSLLRSLHEATLAERCMARADPTGPFERFDPSPTFEACDPSFIFSSKNCIPSKIAIH